MNNENFNEIIEKIAGNNLKSSNKAFDTLKNDDVYKMTNVISKISTDDENIAFLRELKPLLSEERQKKADEAISFLQFLNGIESFKEMM